MSVYDKYYKTKDLFGDAYPELIEFFKKYEPKGSLIDVGCGQGRDALPLARLGYKITGIDNSKKGIEQMLHNAKSEKLNVAGLVEDIFVFDQFRGFDFVLFDSMFHFTKRDKQKETSLLDRIANEIKAKTVICVCIQDTGSKVKILKETIQKTGQNFEVLNDSSLVYIFEDKETGHKSKTKYCMYIIKKI